MTVKQKVIYQTFIDKGEDAYIQVIEEFSEVIKEITKLKRGKGNEEDLREEHGDALNAIQSLLYFKDWNEDQLNIDRLKKLYSYWGKNYTLNVL